MDVLPAGHHAPFVKGYAMTKSCDGVMLMRCPKGFLRLDSTCASVALCLVSLPSASPLSLVIMWLKENKAIHSGWRNTFEEHQWSWPFLD
ncbi:hypothetical protein BJX62DRAFT_216148 [Aspergillus germanicus]